MKKLVLTTAVAGLMLTATACGTGTDSAAKPSSTTAAASSVSQAPVQPKKWVEVFRATAHQSDDADPRERTKTFRLDGKARLRYTVTGTANRTDFLGRAADILFQDVKLDKESSRIDTIVKIDEPGKGTHDLGDRSGEFFMILQALGGWAQAEEPGGVPVDDWSNVTVTAIVEQQK